MTLRVFASLLILVTSLSGPALAQVKVPTAKDKTEARAHFDQGNVHFNLDEWPLAIEEFRAAYRILPDPVFLYNIAQCHRKMGHEQEALNFYRKYLREKPDAKNRPEVEKRIEELEEAMAAAPAPGTTPPAPAATPTAVPPPPASPPTPTAAPIETTPASTATTPAPAAGGLDLTASTPPAPDPEKSPAVWERWWFWTGAGAVVLAGATIAIVAATSSSAPAHYQGTLSPGVVEVPR